MKNQLNQIAFSTDAPEIPTINELLDSIQAASLLCINPHTLEVWRSNKRYSIPYVKVGRLVKYRRDDLVKWLDSRIVSNVGDSHE